MFDMSLRDLMLTATTQRASDSNSPRNIILCFDGTGNKFGTNSNVIRFFHALDKSKRNEQIVYYQAGIGSYNKLPLKTEWSSWISTNFEEALALNFPLHVKDGYRFLVQNHRLGDKVFMFGFSRGAYTARALAGMIHKIGLLPPHSESQVDFAFAIYQEGSGIANEFRRMFGITIKIEFLGVWDSVSSIGLTPRTLPYSSQNDGIVVFRHALALDECRVRFRPSIWDEPVAVREELDDEPVINVRGKESRDRWVYRPPTRTDVREVWFAGRETELWSKMGGDLTVISTGCHADVGGGSHANDVYTSLSNIPLRWMIKECFVTNSGIMFDKGRLKDIGMCHSELLAKQAARHECDPVDTPSIPSITEKDSVDALAKLHSQLTRLSGWWLIEYFPTITTYQRMDGSWLRYRLINEGRGRYLSHGSGKIKVHISVKERIERTKGKKEKYTPAAYNWEIVAAEMYGVVEWVD